MLTLLMIFSFALGQQTYQSATKSQNSHADDKPRDANGRVIMKGPVGGLNFNNVHVISDTVGVIGRPAIVTNSVIEAPVCIQSSEPGAFIDNNILNCNLCIEFLDRVLINNVLKNNQCAGQGTNRPDVFHW
ncbi:hypothetical protein [Burkholderia sp. Bp8991]|uniref:hypothetical protein n=1 Tax=Burkholderia sp. Bp8991 TaxID=2184553 RepID=UPI000F5A9561|nr:hypothetical protein [Burkholderia sp. Bp8991]